MTDEKTALISDIKRSSFHDGPGIRTTVFFKGCPLSCLWCHNPECISTSPELMLYPDKCIGCGKCDEGCFSGARVLCGKEVTVRDIIEAARADRVYYGERGGVTLSGGEPLLQGDFVRELISALRAEGISTVIETSLAVFDADILRECDAVLADMKAWDDEIHRKYVGISSEVIKRNFVRLDSLSVPIVARTPFIPDIDQGIEQISLFMKGLKNTVSYEILPYHPLGKEKYAALSRDFHPFTVPTKEQIKEQTEKYGFIRRKI